MLIAYFCMGVLYFMWVPILQVSKFYKKVESCPLDCLKLLCNASSVVRSVFVLRTKELSQSLLSNVSEPCDACP